MHELLEDASKLTKKADRRDEERAKALLGFGKLNMLEAVNKEVAGSKPPQFGKYNPRPVSTRAVKQLVTAFLTQGRMATREPLYLLVKKEWVQEGTYGPYTAVLGDLP